MKHGPYTQGELDPALAETAVAIELTLDTSSAVGIQDSPVGACEGQLEIDAN